MAGRSGASFYKKEYKKTFQMLDDQCKTADQYAQVCAMALSRCRLQFAAAAELFAQANILDGYDCILTDMEHFVCDETLITNDMLQDHVNWCLEIKRFCEGVNTGYLAPWRKQFLPDVTQSLGEALSNWICEYGEMYREAIFNSDTRAFIGLGIDIVSCYEYSHFIHPSSFNYYEYIRSCHQDIEEIGQKRDALAAYIESQRGSGQLASKPQTVQSKELEKAIEECKRLGNLFLEEAKQYLGEASAEHERLKAEYRPPAPEDLVLTIREMERIRADIQFVTTGTATNEDIRQRLHDYRTLDIVSE